MPCEGDCSKRVACKPQADIDSAFRRVPVAPDHRWACGVAFRVNDQVSRLFLHVGLSHSFPCQVMVAQHFALPFGAVASVHAWERVGAAVAHLARKYLKIALLRYVDDLFAPERLDCNPM